MWAGIDRCRALVDARTVPTAVVLAALLVYAAVLFVVIPAAENYLGSRYGVSFADDYDRLANNIVSGHGYRYGPDLPPTMMREPGYPWFLAAVFKLLGPTIEAARFANLLLAGVAAFLLLRLAGNAGLTWTEATLAAAIFLFHPGTLIAAARGGFEMFFVFLLIFFMLAFYRAMQAGTSKYYLLAGFLLGLVVLTRNTMMLFPFLLLGYLLLIARTARERTRYSLRTAALLVVMVAVLSPWIIRNYAVSGEIIPTTTMQGIAVQTGQHICEGLSFNRGLQELDTEAASRRDSLARNLGYSFEGGYYQYFRSTREEINFSRYLMQNAVARYVADPALWVRCAAQNVFNFWFAGKTWQVTWLNVAIQAPFLMLAFVGCYSISRRGQWRQMALPLLLIVYLYAIHIPIHAQARYSVPLIPFIAIFASAGIFGLLRMPQRRVPQAGGVNEAAKS